MTTPLPQPRHSSPDLLERSVSAFFVLLEIGKRVVFVLLWAGVAAYLASMLYLALALLAGMSDGKLQQSVYAWADAFRHGAWILGAIFGGLRQFRAWSKARREGEQREEPVTAEEAKAVQRAWTIAAREAALAEVRKRRSAMEASPGGGASFSRAVWPALKTLPVASLVGFLAGLWIGLMSTLIIFSFALSPLGPQEWAVVALSLSATTDDPLGRFIFKVIFAFCIAGALLAALVSFVVTLLDEVHR